MTERTAKKKLFKSKQPKVMISFIYFLVPYIFEIKFEIIDLVNEFEDCDVQCSEKNGEMPFLHQGWIN